MLKFTEEGRLCGCFFGIGEAIAAFAAEAAADVGTAAAASAATDAAATAGIESITVTAPEIASGITAADIGGGVLGLAGAATPLLAGSAAAAPAAGSAAAGTGATPPVTPSGAASPTAPAQPLGTSPSPLTPTANTGVTGGPGASAASAAPPPGISSTPDVTQIQPLSGAQSPLSGGSPLPSQGLDSSVSSAQPGSVGSGAASGTPSSVSGVNAPSSVGPASSVSAPNITPSSDLSGLSQTPSLPTAPESGAGPTTSVGKFIDSPSLKGGLDVLGDNATTALGVAGLGLDFLMGQKQPAGEAQISQAAQTAQQQAGQLEGYLATGQLPPGIQSSINAAIANSEATIRSQYASRGMTGSSAEAQDLANAQTSGAGQAAQIAEQLYSQGVQESQISSQLYGEIMNQSVAEDKDLSDAIGNFSSSLAGGNRPIVIQNSGTV